jgi:CubicO group peptidase (beta-lactamase class C family)
MTGRLSLYGMPTLGGGNEIMKTLAIKRVIHLGIIVLTYFITLNASIADVKSSEVPDATQSDPAILGWMMGSPPPEDRILRFSDGSYFRFPAMRWSVSNFRQLMPTVNVSRGLKAPVPLPRAMREDIDQLRFTPLGSADSMTWTESLAANYTDGIVVLHKGRIVYERYFGVFKEDGQHGAMSVTKSLIGTLGAMLVAEGALNPSKRVVEYVPELANSAFGDATLRQLLDMTTALKFSEDYADPTAEVWAHARAGNPLPKPKNYSGPRSYFEFLQTVKKQGEHGEAFGYKTANTDALGWIIARVTGRSVAVLLSERIWRHLGAEQDAYFSVDSIGTPFAGGGLNTGLRDLARFGEMVRNNGRFNGRQIVPEAAIKDIRRGATALSLLRLVTNFYRGGAIATCGGLQTMSTAHSQREGYMAKRSILILRLKW